MVQGGHSADGPLLHPQAAYQVGTDGDPLLLPQAAHISLFYNTRSFSSHLLLHLGIFGNGGQQVVQLLPVLLQGVPSFYPSSTNLKNKDS